MRYELRVALGIGFSLVTTLGMTTVTKAEQPLFVAYPPENHETTAEQIFLIGTAPPEGDVFVNGEAIARSPAGHFAPSFPLQVGENRFVLRYGEQEITRLITRNALTPAVPEGVAFAEGSLTPAENIARLPGETLCFEAIAPPNATVSVTLAEQTIPLLPQSQTVELPPNSAVLTFQNRPMALAGVETYQGCTLLDGSNTGYLTSGNNIISGTVVPDSTSPLDLGSPAYELSLNGETVRQSAPGTVEILSPAKLQVVEVTAASGTARTGPSTNYSRLTPLPTGVRAAVTGREGEWLRLDYGAWIRASETEVIPNAMPPRSLIRSIQAHEREGWTEITFPLQTPVPVSVQQGSDTFTLTLHNTTAQTDTILLNDDPLIERLDWRQSTPSQVEYTFHLKTDQQWGYDLAYEGTSLILSLRHAPELQTDQALPLSGVSILLDPGHGSENDLGARGPTGYPEKDVALTVSRLIESRLEARGATVYMTREGDDDLYPQDRVDQINAIEPAIALSIHYNALPDNGDAVNTAGIGTFWYNTQAHDLAVFLHNYLVETLDRPSYGVFWNNLALTRPTVTPAVLLELGFMINPTEFEWIVDPEEQERLAEAIAAGVTQWVYRHQEQNYRE